MLHFTHRQDVPSSRALLLGWVALIQAVPGVGRVLSVGAAGAVPLFASSCDSSGFGRVSQQARMLAQGGLAEHPGAPVPGTSGLARVITAPPSHLTYPSPPSHSGCSGNPRPGTPLVLVFHCTGGQTEVQRMVMEETE